MKYSFMMQNLAIVSDLHRHVKYYALKLKFSGRFFPFIQKGRILLKYRLKSELNRPRIEINP